jgi:hypothetical protein
MMRTTLNLPDDVADALRAVAEAERISLGDAAARLIRKGLRPQQPVVEGAAFPSFVVRKGAGPISLEQTLAIEDDEL